MVGGPFTYPANSAGMQETDEAVSTDQHVTEIKKTIILCARPRPHKLKYTAKDRTYENEIYI